MMAVFPTSITSIISRVINIVLNRATPKGKMALTMKSISDCKVGTVLRYYRERDGVTILREPGDHESIFGILERLDIEPDLLLGY